MIIIVGGSIAGLMAGIVFQRKGYQVHILEESLTSDRESHAAGIRLGPDAQRFLEEYGILTQADSVPCDGLQFINQQGQRERFVGHKMRMTSWDCLFHRLRGAFDGQISPSCPKPSFFASRGQEPKYASGMSVVNVSPNQDGQIVVICEDLKNDRSREIIEAERVIIADGANSRLRQVLEKQPPSSPSYAGYVAWRGIVDEGQVSDSTRQAIGSSFLVHKTPPNYILVYIIPGANGSTKPGERYLNFVWYYQCPERSKEFETIMTDAHGHRHRATVPPGGMDTQVWERQQAYGRRALAPPFVELVQKTKQPFISTVREAQALQASYFDGQVCVLGDALATFRPHIAMSVNQAALNSLQLARMLDGEISAEQWRSEAERYGRITSRLSTLAGDFAMWPFSWRLLSSASAYLLELALGGYGWSS